MDRTVGEVHELEWEKHCILNLLIRFQFTNLKLKISMSFNYECVNKPQ